jgi:hypothetical protein
MTEPEDEPVTADSLIERYGNQAYHEGLDIVVRALNRGDEAFSCRVASAEFELIRRAYDKIPRKMDLCPSDS